jgi:hypothetical protein
MPFFGHLMRSGHLRAIACFSEENDYTFSAIADSGEKLEGDFLCDVRLDKVLQYGAKKEHFKESW